ncbi:hypothetical protein A7J71_18120 [Achromobacter insolitus]|uniref:hypothetical protein n=1 Tax=Achromobacter insolitus TaxID=217204 RepID=UPI0007C7EAA2|nr:hypothetical protein [Achromobacter insolitus]OAE52884.1 hypothetical protein A7J71_18120 [Achromobacter insolitus]OCZ50630.1 hypothetical protein A7P22_15220 [Achromobacter insolitus]
MNDNLLKLSACAQLALNQAPTSPLPASPADGYVAIDPATREVCVRDAGAWVRVTPRAGWFAVFQTTGYFFTGFIWQAIVVQQGMPVLPSLSNGTDFNALTDTAVATVASNAAAATMLNIPIALAGTFYGGRLNSPGTTTTQLYVTYTGRLFTRGQSSGTYNTWNESASINSPVFTGTPRVPNLRLGNVAGPDVFTLDYYEEGSWTPLLVGGTTPGTPTYNTQQGRYTRIGNRVHVTGRMGISAKGGLAGTLFIDGLPYAVAAGTQNVGGVALGYISGLTLAAPHQVTAFPNPGSTRLLFYKAPQTGGGVTMFDTDIGTTFITYFALTYEV